jgi:two-component system response regulator MtrA
VTKILVIDDDNALREMVGIVLENAGYQSVFCADGAQAVSIFNHEKPDLVLLDVMLPGEDGVSVCKKIRVDSGVPIIMLTARGETEDVVQGLEAGADDYIVKPFQPNELIARVKARLRPMSETEAKVLNIGPLVLDIEGHEVRRGDTAISLTPLEFKLLYTLASKPNLVFSREMLLDQVWEYDYKADTRLVNVHVQRLRAKIEDDPDNPKIVTTVRGIGYRAGSS